LRADATNSGVALPPEYEFSFLAQSKNLSLQSNYLRPLAIQLGEVKAISDVLFQAKINALEALRRERIAPEDTAGSATDYIGEKSTTNELAVLSPYELTFRCFSPELASVLSNFASSEHGFVVKTINVEAEGASSGATTDGNPISPNMQFPEGVPPGPGRGPYIPGRFPPTTATTPAPAAASRGLPIVLDEKKLRVTISLVVVKVLPPTQITTTRPAGPRPMPGPSGG
jgi:hypothetical protein